MSLQHDVTFVIGLTRENNEKAYWVELQDISIWYSDDNLSLYFKNIKEIMFDFWKFRTDKTPVYEDADPVQNVKIFLGIQISDSFSRLRLPWCKEYFPIKAQISIYQTTEHPNRRHTGVIW